MSRLILVLNVARLHHLCDRIFWIYGHDAVARHLIPYRDYHPEYPPLAAVLFMIPGAARDWLAYATWFAGMMLTVDLLTVVLVRHAAEGLMPCTDGWRAAFSYTALSFATTAVLNKFDVLPGMLTLVAVLGLASRREQMAWIALAAAVLLKGYALVLAPLFLLYRYRVHGGARWWRGPVAGALFTGVILLPVLVVGRRGLVASLFYHAHRGLEIESIYASVILVAHHIWPLHVTVTGGAAVRSRDVFSSLNGTLHVVAPLALAAGLAVAYVVAWVRLRRDPAPTALLVLSMAVVTAFMMTFKALPTHYLLWVAPMVAVTLGRPVSETGRAAIAFCIAVGLGIVILSVWLPLRHLDSFATAVMVSRNIAILAAFVLLLRAAWPSHAACTL